MHGFESILDQKQPIRILTTFLHKRAIPHALLFTGIEGIGKRTAAMVFAMACNCNGNITGKKEHHTEIPPQQSPCGCCNTCRRIESESHPDVILIKPVRAVIRIAQIRSLCQMLALKPYEARIRVVIISDAQAMNREAGNALLKILEEPPAHTILILTATQTSDLLSTVVSRCLQIRFQPISRKSLEIFLAKSNALSDEDAVIIASMANGSLSKALSMIKPANLEYWKNLRKWLIHDSGLDAPASLSSRPIASMLAFAERLSKNKKNLPDFLEVMKTWLRDLVIWKFNPKLIINKDLTQKIQYASQQMDLESLISKIKAIEVAEKDIRANANTRLALEVMFLKLVTN